MADNKIIYKYITGSYLLADNFNNINYVVLIDTQEYRQKKETIEDYNYDIITRSLDYEKQLIEGKIFTEDSIYLASQIIASTDINYPFANFEWQKLEKRFKKSTKDYILEIVKNKDIKKIYNIYVLFKLWEQGYIEVKQNVYADIEKMQKNDTATINRVCEYIQEGVNNG